MMKVSSAFLKQKEFYQQNYVYLNTPSYLLPNTPAIFLGDLKNRLCRFCGKSKPEVSFKRKAHAIPECLGNKSLFTRYECDDCNRHFGESIEYDLGNWSIVTRALAGVRGKKGIPTIMNSNSQSGLKVTRNSEGLVYTEFGNTSIIVLNEANKQARLKAKRYAFAPKAVLKAFVKIGLTLLPDSEIENFPETLSWIRDKDNSKPFIRKCPLLETSIPGPMWNQLIVVRLLRRKPHSNICPYAILVLGFANHLFQIWLPSRRKDKLIWSKAPEIPPLIPIKLTDAAFYGNPVTKTLNLDSCETVRDERVQHAVSGD